MLNTQTPIKDKSPVPEGWVSTTLRGQLQTCRNGLVCQQDADPTRSIPVARIETISDRNINWRRVGYVPLEEANFEYLLRKGDILLSHINSVKHIGKVARKTDDRPLIHGMNLMLLRFNEHMDPGFGFALMASRQTKTYMERRAKKAVNQASINRQDIFALPILLPPLPEQRAIATVLDSIDEAIERTEAVITATERLRDALLHELLSRGVPGWHSDWKKVPSIGTIPADWEVVRLGDVLKSTTYGTNASLNEVGATPVLRMNNLQDGTLDLTDIRRADLSKKESDNLNLVPGDILFNRTNSLDLVGKVAIVRDLPQPISFASYLVRLRVREIRADPYWLSAMLWASNYQARIRRFATPGVSQANINPTSLKSLTIPLPSMREQEVIAGVLDSIDTAFKQARNETNALTFLKASAADALLTGRVRMNLTRPGAIVPCIGTT